MNLIISVLSTVFLNLKNTLDVYIQLYILSLLIIYGPFTLTYYFYNALITQGLISQ